MPPTSLNGPWVGTEFKKYLKVTALCCRFAVALLSNRHHFDSTILTVALGDAILESETVHPGLLPARIDSSRAPRGKRLAVLFFDNLINRSACAEGAWSRGEQCIQTLANGIASVTGVSGLDL